MTAMAAASVTAACGSRAAERGAAEPAGEMSGVYLLGANGRGTNAIRPTVEGDVPAGLRGVLYRNGPGLFERNGYRKTNLLDGDGLVQRLAFGEGGVTYRSAFVRTPKFVEEEAAGRFRYGTWTTRAPGGPLSNLGGGRIESQAGVTVYRVGERVFALDEVAPLFEIDPETLETLGPLDPGDSDRPFSNKAHTKLDPVTGDWVLAGATMGRRQMLHVAVRDRSGALKSHRIIGEIPNVYWHDFMITRTKLVFVFHPAQFNPLGFLAGFESFTDTLSWRPDAGNKVLVINREGDPDPVWLEAPAAFMWHGLNAYDRADGRIVADFAGYDDPDHFIGPDAQLTAFMQGREARARHPGKVRRYVIDLAARRIEENIVHDAHHEFPTIAPAQLAGEHRHGYFACGGAGGVTTGVAHIDFETGARAAYDFGANIVAGEPIFAAYPSSAGRGWLLQQCLDGAAGNTFFAVFDAERVAAGPVAKLRLPFHAPISFHGCWAG